MASLLISLNKTYQNLLNWNRRLNYSTTNFDKILIANRGEIACRIIKTAKKLGIKTVSVYSEADYKSKHVELSDESVYIGPTASKDSYLNMGKILEAAKLTKSAAIHPGYGFLSENHEFVKILEDNNIIFIGPPADVIRKMGDKLESKRIAISAGVHTIPGYDGIIENEDHCLRIAEDIGYPVMIKASAGGGGKGMRIAENHSQIKEGYKLSTQEALSSFGDGRILLEKFIKKPRHIEVQVLADKHGNVVHLGERECSIQRRNQKIIEEAPSPFLNEELRSKMTSEAIKLCKQLNYSSAGTVEFLVDEDRNYYFLEMNTRLQVEHPVTEFVTNTDLVEEMIRIASGEMLRMDQKNIQIQGWSLESRVYAEDPYKNFGTPCIGKIYKYIEPNFSEDVRFDSGVKEGSEINVFYDPLICKLITFGENRADAINKHIQALDSYVIHGVTTNIPILRDILKEPNFQLGNLTTDYLKTTYPQGFSGADLSTKEKNELIALTSAIHAKFQKIQNVPLVATLNTDKYNIILNGTDVNINNNQFKIKGNINLSSPVISVEINDAPCVFQLLSKDGIGNFQLMYHGTIFNLNIMRENVAELMQFVNTKKKTETAKIVPSPMPGLIKSLFCKTGDFVTEGQEICIIEAMKMQNCITAPTNGKIKKVCVAENDVVSEMDPIIEFE